MPSTVGSFRLGSEAVSGTFLRAAPTAAITAPASLVTSQPITVTWSFTSPVGRAQAQYRVRVTNLDQTVTVFDTFGVASAVSSASVTVPMSGGSSYRMFVSAADRFDWSAEASVVILYDVSTGPVYPDETRVGSVYEMAINGVGLMIADHPDKESRYTRRTVPLDKQRLATSDTPFSEKIDRYTMVGQIDWSDGAGQEFYNRESSTPQAYGSSSGVAPFEVGRLTLSPGVVPFVTAAGAGARFLAVASGKLYMAEPGQVSVMATPTSASLTTFSVAGAATPVAFTSDGVYWYLSDGANIYRNNTAASAAAWSTVDAQIIKWCTDRIIVAYKGGTSSVANVVEVLNYATGVGVGGSQKWTFEEETQVRSITSGDGYVWWAATRGAQSAIYGWKLGSTDSFILSFQMPQGQEARAISYYQGNVFIRAAALTDTGTKVIIYRAATSSGMLVPSRVLEIDDAAVDQGDGDFSGDDRFVYFSWRKMNGTSAGIGKIDLSTGGWCKSLQSAVTGPVRSIVQYGSLTAFSVDNSGFSIEDVGHLAASGTLDTSLWDLGTGLRKSFELMELHFTPLPLDSSIAVHCSFDGGITFTLFGTVTGPLTQSCTFPISREADSIALRFVLTAATGLVQGPSLRSVTIRAYPMGIADQELVVTINCADQVTGLNGRPLPENAPGAGSRRLRALEALAQSKVAVQDVDWAVTRQTQVFDLISVEAISAGVFDSHVNRQAQAMPAKVTLRRNVK